MRKEIATKWVERLRSGLILQGTGVMHEVQQGAPDLLCCLGVLCQIAVEGGVIGNPTQGIHCEKTTMFYGPFHNLTGLPKEVVEWSLMRTSSGKFPPRIFYRVDGSVDHFHSLSTLNDAGASFEKISDAIEKHQAQI